MPFAASLNTALRGKNLHRKRKRSSSPRKEWGDEESRGAKVKAIGARARSRVELVEEYADRA